MTGTRTASGGGDGPRPMTSVKAAGYQSKPMSGSRAFDPMGGASMGPAPPLEEKEDSSPASKASEMEKRVHRLLEASAEAARTGDTVMALERAKEAGKRERALVRHRETNDLQEQNNVDLTFSVFFCLANAYSLNSMFTEALATYDLIYRNKDYLHRGRVKVNVGNIHFLRKDYPEALKHYKMALDQIPPTNKHMRLRIERNVGATLIRMGRFQEAIEKLEGVMEQFDDASPSTAGE
jgi:intraflagellar transport protein 88